MAMHSSTALKPPCQDNPAAEGDNLTQAVITQEKPQQDKQLSVSHIKENWNFYKKHSYALPYQGRRLLET